MANLEKKQADKGTYQNRVELLQGTLDMLILQTLNGVRNTDTGSARPSARVQAKSCRWRRVRFIPRYIGSNGRDGFARSGS
jgi:hypothetical protein